MKTKDFKENDTPSLLVMLQTMGKEKFQLKLKEVLSLKKEDAIRLRDLKKSIARVLTELSERRNKSE